MKVAPASRVLAQWQIYALAGEAHLDPRTVAAVLQGRAGTNRRQQVIEAAARIGMALPPLPGGFDETGVTRVRAT
jgi:hypothetical protein